eukprot:TRINITY_DN6358_c0_g1_i1.p1 TRINITY_DN6358_c0_g1~~TRINITY_DN6358_c0_g1_i1.p1  ORF type:complete len:318 (-),score=61.96 TRINITY_DN6358_c0_g1_i1:631-1584(-)
MISTGPLESGGVDAGKGQLLSLSAKMNLKYLPEKGALLLDAPSVVPLPTANAFGHAFRAYEEESERRDGVANFYYINHINQTYDFVQRMKAKHFKLDKAVMSVWEAALLLNDTVDESDPDLDMPQIEHLLQTAEAIRKAHPDEDWFHLVGFIHDLGKVLVHPTFGSEPQWAVVGDTYPVGCRFDPAIVHSSYFDENPDAIDQRYNSKLGVYQEGCGLDKVEISWSHDEYMHSVMRQNGCTLPEPAYFIIRYHSFYSLHKDACYDYLLNEHDRKMMPWVHEFNKFDLYSKSKEPCDVEKLRPYYLSLIQKYFPDKLRW